MLLKYLLAQIIILIVCINCHAIKNKQVFNILDFGAKNDKNVNSSKAIQNAIDACSKAGGGTVLIPAGNYSTSTIRLKDNIELNLSEGANLYAIADISLYKNDKEGLEDAGDTFIPSLIVIKKAKNVSITGKGFIIGQPEFYFTEVKDNDTYPGWIEHARKSGVNMNRPWVKDPKISLVYASDCEELLLQDITILNSPNWSCHIQWSKNIRILGIKILSSLTVGVNSDGLDIDGCKNVQISNCVISTGDDAICLKTTRQGKRSETCEDIIVTNCTLSSSSCALKIGTETYSDFKRILFNNCTITKSNRAIGIIVRDGAKVENVTFSNIKVACARKPFYWWGNGEAFHFNVIKRNNSSAIGSISNVLLHNISGTVEGSSQIVGYEDTESATINDIRMQNIRLKINPESEKDKRTKDVLYISNANNIAINNITILWSMKREMLWQNALYIKDVSRYNVNNLKIVNNNIADKIYGVLLNNTKQGYLKFLSNKKQANKVQVIGNKTKSLSISNASKSVSVMLGLENQVKIEN